MGRCINRQSTVKPAQPQGVGMLPFRASPACPSCHSLLATPRACLTALSPMPDADRNTSLPAATTSCSAAAAGRAAR